MNVIGGGGGGEVLQHEGCVCVCGGGERGLHGYYRWGRNKEYYQDG